MIPLAEELRYLMRDDDLDCYVKEQVIPLLTAAAIEGSGCRIIDGVPDDMMERLVKWADSQGLEVSIIDSGSLLLGWLHLQGY